MTLLLCALLACCLTTSPISSNKSCGADKPGRVCAAPPLSGAGPADVASPPCVEKVLGAVVCDSSGPGITPGLWEYRCEVDTVFIWANPTLHTGPNKWYRRTIDTTCVWQRHECEPVDSLFPSQWEPIVVPLNVW